MGLTLRPMTEADVPFSMELKNLAGWNQTEADWRRLIRLDPDGCFVGEADGLPVGTVTTTSYGREVAWIGMVLVHPDQRRRGYGRALLTGAIDALKRAGVATVKLDATDAGRALYLQYGFEDEYGVTRFGGAAAGDAGSGCRSMTRADLPALPALDTPAFGVDRSRVLEPLAVEHLDYGAVCEDAAGRVRGYVLCRPGARAWFVGPLVALDEEIGRELLGWALARLAGRPVMIDVPHPNAAAMDFARQSGLQAQRSFTRMYNGSEPVRGRPEQVWATAGPAKG